MVHRHFQLVALTVAELPESTEQMIMIVLKVIYIYIRERKEKKIQIQLTFSPSEVQSEIGHPWSPVENGQAPLEM